MSIFSRLFGRKDKAQQQARVGGVNDFMTLVSVYYKATLVAQLGISNLNLPFLSDLRAFKQTLHVPTVNNKLGVGERSRSRKMAMDIYGLSDSFFKQIDNSVKRRCRTINDVNSYSAQFQGFLQDLLMVMGNQMQWKLRLPSFFHKALRDMTAKTVHEVLTKNNWKDESVRRACIGIRHYQEALQFDEAWMTEYAFNCMMLAKKEPRNANTEEQ